MMTADENATTLRRAYAAFNEGVRQCRGAMLALLNNDMELDPGWLSAMHAALEAERHSRHAAGVLRRGGTLGNRLLQF